MGALISLIKQSNANEETPFASLALVDLNIQVDPSPQEASLVLQSNLLLSQSDTLLPLFQEYQGCGLLIRAAISSPSKLTEDAAWEKVLPAVAKLRDYYEFALKLDQVASSIIQFLCSNSSLLANLDANTTSAKKLADLLLIVAKYDECKMSNPNIQNDFSYYRRTLSKMRMSNPVNLFNLVSSSSSCKR